jgi:diguanylate cyclase (GGDEF)-like protein
VKSLWESTAESASLAEIQSLLERRVWGTTILLMLVLTPLSVLRVINTGWLPIYTFHCALFAVMFVVYLFGDRVPIRARVVMALAYIQTAGAAGLILMGLLGFGFLWLVANSFLIAIMYGHRAGLIGIGLNVIIVLAAMFGFRHGLLAIPVDANDYMHSPAVWALGITMIVLFSWTLMNSIGLYKEAVVDLLKKTDQQRLEIERLATYDHLTGLVQVRVAHERLPVALHHARRSGHKVAVLFLDLDGFKQVNDSHGHGAGDHVLRAVSHILRAVVRESDTVSRIGGDEFMVVLEDLADPEVAASVAGRVLFDLARPMQYHNVMLQVGASIGIALFPDHGADAMSLQHAADGAMYTVKNSGKGGYVFSGRTDVQRTLQLSESVETCKVQQLYYKE